MSVEPGAPSHLRVASIPAGHPYVTRLELPTGGVTLLPDPRPPGAPAGRWWPPVMLDRAWIDAHAGEFDVMHLHFGSESLSLAALDAALEALARAGRPLVYTVHDLVHPQLSAQDHHRAQLDLLIARAQALITLTAGAAREIARRWGRRATVIPHPRMLCAEPHPRRVGRSEPFVAGVHLRDLRPNIDGPGVARALALAASKLRARSVPVRARVAVFERVRDPAAQAEIRAICLDRPQISLVEHERFDDAGLVSDLCRLDLSVLPYAYGTHSGWAELCWDLALPVAGAPVGYIDEQHSEAGWFTACDPTDPASLARAIEHAIAVRGSAGIQRMRRARRRQRDADQPFIVRAHAEIYARVLGG